MRLKGGTRTRSGEKGVETIASFQYTSVLSGASVFRKAFDVSDVVFLICVFVCVVFVLRFH